MNEQYLAHWGIKGMKWGIRRYQNEDGTYTAEGKKRRRMSDDWLEPKIKAGKDKAPISKGEKAVKGAEKITEGSQKTYESFSKIKNRKKAAARNEELNRQLSKMSDEEIRKKVNRMNLEKQYKDAIRARETVEGKVSAMDVINGVAGIVGIVGGLVAIGTAIKTKDKE